MNPDELLRLATEATIGTLVVVVMYLLQSATNRTQERLISALLEQREADARRSGALLERLVGLEKRQEETLDLVRRASVDLPTPNPAARPRKGE